MARFVAIDVETANARRSSICQIGLVVYDNRRVVDEWSTLVNPEDEFHPINVSIHGIGLRSVASAPTLPEIFGEVDKRIAGACIASYGDFDRSALSQASARYELQALSGQWLDLQHVVKQAWPPSFTADGWALKKVCAQLDIDLSSTTTRSRMLVLQVMCSCARRSTPARGQETGWNGLAVRSPCLPHPYPRRVRGRLNPMPWGCLRAPESFSRVS